LANGWTLRVGANGTADGANKLTAAAGAEVSDTAAFPLGRWVQVVMTHDMATTTTFLYKDGVQVASGNIAPSNNTNVVTIGLDFIPNLRVWDGYIDDVRVYNRALTAQEVSDTKAGYLRFG